MSSEETGWDGRDPGGFHYLRNTTIPSCALDDVRVTPAMLRVLACCGSYATERNRHWVWAKHSTIADRLGISRQEVNILINSLEEYGYVEVKRGRRDDGGRDRNRIRLLMEVTVPDQYVRKFRPRPRKGIGGRPKKATPRNSEFHTPPKLRVSTPETQLVSTPETQLVSTPETQLVSTPETQRGSPDPATAHEIGVNGTSETPYQDLLAGSSNRISQQECATRTRTTAPSQKNSPAETDPLAEARARVIAAGSADYARVARKGGAR